MAESNKKHQKVGKVEKIAKKTKITRMQENIQKMQKSTIKCERPKTTKKDNNSQFCQNFIVPLTGKQNGKN